LLSYRFVLILPIVTFAGWREFNPKRKEPLDAKIKSNSSGAVSGFASASACIRRLLLDA
jgi:hypothetical protein